MSTVLNDSYENIFNLLLLLSCWSLLVAPCCSLANTAADNCMLCCRTQMAFLYDHINHLWKCIRKSFRFQRYWGKISCWWTNRACRSWGLPSARTSGSLARWIEIGSWWTRRNAMHLGRRLHVSCWWMIGGWWQVIYNFFVTATVVIKFEEFADFNEKAPLTAGVIFPITERHHDRIWREQVASTWTASSDRQGNSCLPFNEDKISIAVTLAGHVYSNKAFYGSWSAWELSGSFSRNVHSHPTRTVPLAGCL